MALSKDVLRQLDWMYENAIWETLDGKVIKFIKKTAWIDKDNYIQVATFSKNTNVSIIETYGIDEESYSEVMVYTRKYPNAEYVANQNQFILEAIKMTTTNFPGKTRQD